MRHQHNAGVCKHNVGVQTALPNLPWVTGASSSASKQAMGSCFVFVSCLVWRIVTFTLHKHIVTFLHKHYLEIDT